MSDHLCWKRDAFETLDHDHEVSLDWCSFWGISFHRSTRRLDRFVSCVPGQLNASRDPYRIQTQVCATTSNSRKGIDAARLWHCSLVSVLGWIDPTVGFDMYWNIYSGGMGLQVPWPDDGIYTHAIPCHSSGKDHMYIVYTYLHIYIYIYMYICICICIYTYV